MSTNTTHPRRARTGPSHPKVESGHCLLACSRRRRQDVRTRAWRRPPMSTEPPRRQTLGPKQRRSSVLAHPKKHAPLKASQTRTGEREKIRRRSRNEKAPARPRRLLAHDSPFYACAIPSRACAVGREWKGGPSFGREAYYSSNGAAFSPLRRWGEVFLATFYLDLFRFIACRPSSNPSRRERKFLPSNLAEPRGFWGWGSRRKRFGSCCGGLRVVHRCVVCWSCCFLDGLLACTGCHFQKPVFVAVLLSLSFEHFPS